MPDIKNEDWGMMYNHAPSYYFSCSNDGHIIRINDTFLLDLHFTRDEIVGKKTIHDLLSAGSKIFFQTHLYPLIKMRKRANEIYLTFLNKEKEEIPVLVNFAISDNGGQLEFNCGGLQVTQRNRFEEELLEAKRKSQEALNENAELIETRKQLQALQRKLEKHQRDLSEKNIDQIELGKVLAHDLQEPLRKINMFSSRILSGQNQDIAPQSIHALIKITGFVDKVRRLLDDLLKFNSLDRNSIAQEQVNLSEVIAAAISDDDLLAQGIDVHFMCDKTITIISDFKLIVALFTELMKSAIKFKDPDVKILRINISTDIISENIYTEIKNKYQYEEYLRIRFEDNGMGNPFVEKNAFQLFGKSHHTGNELGIGLAYCRRIVQMLNGKISVSSKGIGTTFIILLPSKNIV